MNVDEFIKQHEHKAYCEIIISPNGSINYAIPSHTEALIAISKMTKEDLREMIPHRASPMHWLIEYTRYAICWYNAFILPKQYTEEQKNVIIALCDAGIMTHCIGNVTAEKSLCEKLEQRDMDGIEEFASQSIIL